MPSALELLKQNTAPTALKQLEQNTEKPDLPQTIEPDEGILSNLWKGAKTGVAGTYGGIAGWVGGENAATKYFDDVVQSNQRSREHSGYDADYFLNGSGLAYDLGQLVGSVASLAPTALLPGVGAVGGAAARFVPRLLGSGFARSAASKVGAGAARAAANKWASGEAGQAFIKNAVRYGAGSGGVESLSEGGSGVTEGFKNGDENPYLTGLEITAKNLPLLIASNTLEAATLGRGALRFGGKAGESVAKRAALAVPRATPYAAAQAVQQSGEELLQQRIQEEAFNRPTGGILPSTWTPEEMQAVQDTLAAGGVMGLLGGLPGGMRARTPQLQPKAANDPTYNPALEQARALLNAQYTQNNTNIINANGNIGNSAIDTSGMFSNDTEPTAQPAMSVAEAQAQINQSAGVATDKLDSGINASGVKIEGTRPETIGMINRAAQIYKQLFNRDDFWLSSTVTGHKDGTPHALGYKADVGGSALEESRENRIKFQQALQAEGIGANNEYDQPSDDSTGGHFDLDVRGKNWQTGEDFGGFNPGQSNASPSVGNMSKEQFFAAVAGQESGGNYNAQNGRTGAFGKYQIMPDNWAPWAKEAGLPEGAEQTPENQEIVAKYKLGQYFDQYGPEGALVAWYSGPANAERWANGENTDVWGRSWDAKNGNGDEPSIREYVQQALGRVGATPGSSNADTNIEIPNTKVDTSILLMSTTNSLKNWRRMVLRHLSRPNSLHRKSLYSRLKKLPLKQAIWTRFSVSTAQSVPAIRKNWQR